MDNINLIDLLPNYFRKVKDFIALLETESIELWDLDDLVNRVYDNFFIQTADTETIKYHESLFGIVAQPDESLSFRRARVINRYNNRVPFTIATLKEKLNLLIGFGNWELYLDYQSYDIYIKIKSGEFGIMDEMTNMLVYMLPAYIGPNILQEIQVNGRLETYAAAALNPMMKYFITQDINKNYKPIAETKTATALNPMMRYKLTQDIKKNYTNQSNSNVAGVVSTGTTYRIK